MSEETHDQAPGLPEIRDEAADSPTWVPVLGVVLFLLMAVTFVLRNAIDEGTPPLNEAPTAAVEAAAPAAH